MTPNRLASALEEIWCGPVLPFSYFRKPGTRMYGRTRIPDYVVTGKPPAWLMRERVRTAWAYAGHPAWVDGVRERMLAAMAQSQDGGTAVALVDEVRARMDDRKRFLENGIDPLIDALIAVLDLWIPVEDRDQDDTVYTYGEGYGAAMDNAVDVIATALGMDVA